MVKKLLGFRTKLSIDGRIQNPSKLVLFYIFVLFEKFLKTTYVLQIRLYSQEIKSKTLHESLIL